MKLKITVFTEILLHVCTQNVPETLAGDGGCVTASSLTGCISNVEGNKEADYKSTQSNSLAAVNLEEMEKKVKCIKQFVIC